MILSRLQQLAIAGAVTAAFLTAQASPPATPAAPAKQFKDQAEADLVNAANKNADPKGRLDQLDKWKAGYPDSAYAPERTVMYMFTYTQLKRYHDAIAAAQEVLKTKPNDAYALTTIVSMVQQENPADKGDLEAANTAANYIIDHNSDIYAPGNKPADKSAQEWSSLGPQMKAYSASTLNWVAIQQGEDAVAARLKLDPTQSPLNYWMGRHILDGAKSHPERQPLALFHYARSAVYDGPNALPAANRTQAKSFLDKAYASYHGSPEGEDKLFDLAKTTALPPDGFTIKDINTIAREKQEEDDRKRRENPMIALWTDIKKNLTEKGDDYFKEFDGTEPPAFKGKLVSMTPALRPKTLVLAIEKDGVADCTINLDAPLAGKMEPGGEIEFQGTVRAYTKEPYMITFETEKAKVKGWTGKNGPATPAGPKKAPPKAVKKN